MLVRAKTLGVYNNRRRRPGDTFEVENWELHKGSWMEPLGEIREESPALTAKKKKLKKKATKKPGASPLVGEKNEPSNGDKKTVEVEDRDVI